MKALAAKYRKMDPNKVDGEPVSAEVQMAALQEQLVAVMLDNQHLEENTQEKYDVVEVPAEELRSVHESIAITSIGTSQQEVSLLRQQLEREKEKSRLLLVQLQEQQQQQQHTRDHSRDSRAREKSLPPGDKSPSLPQRIRKRINQLHKTPSCDVEDGGGPGFSGTSGPPTPLPLERISVVRPIGEEKFTEKAVVRPIGEERFSDRLEPDNSCSGSVSGAVSGSTTAFGDAMEQKSPSDFDAESPSRSRFGWRRRGLEKSKSLDQSEFLASLEAEDGGVSLRSPVAAPAEWLDVDGNQRRDSQGSDDGDKGSGLTPGDGITPGSELGLLDPILVPPAGFMGVLPPGSPWWKRAEAWLIQTLVELARDFSEVQEEEQPDGDPDGEQLTVKKLKENILRFGNVMKPFTDLSSFVNSLLHWESPSATLLALVVYLYAVMFGWSLTIFASFGIYKLSVNYLNKRGWTLNLFRGLVAEQPEPKEEKDDSGLGDKFALVLQVARRVQNQSGAVSNTAEKLKNLLLWEHDATQRLYITLWILMLASLVFNPSQICTFCFLYLGIKCAVVDFIFYRYPRIREKYDGTTKLWSTLPTDAELEKQIEKARAENGCSSPDLNTFLEHFGLSASETPLPGWQSGRRCTLVNRDRSLTSAFRNGRLYLTNRLAKHENEKLTSEKLTSSFTTFKESCSPNILTSSPRRIIDIGSGPSKGSNPKHFNLTMKQFTERENSKKTKENTTAFGFLNKGNKIQKIKDEEEEIIILGESFDNADENILTDSKMSDNFDNVCSDSPKDSPKIKHKDFSFFTYKKHDKKELLDDVTKSYFQPKEMPFFSHKKYEKVPAEDSPKHSNKLVEFTLFSSKKQSNFNIDESPKQGVTCMEMPCFLQQKQVADDNDIPFITTPDNPPGSTYPLINDETSSSYKAKDQLLSYELATASSTKNDPPSISEISSDDFPRCLRYRSFRNKKRVALQVPSSSIEADSETSSVTDGDRQESSPEPATREKIMKMKSKLCKKKLDKSDLDFTEKDKPKPSRITKLNESMFYNL